MKAREVVAGEIEERFVEHRSSYFCEAAERLKARV